MQIERGEGLKTMMRIEGGLGFVAAALRVYIESLITNGFFLLQTSSYLFNAPRKLIIL